MSDEFNDIKPHGYSLAEAMSIDLHAHDLRPEAIEKAKALLRLAGYWVIPQHRVEKIGGQSAIPREYLDGADGKKITESVQRGIAHAMGGELYAQQAIVWQQDEPTTENGYFPKRIIRGEISVIRPKSP